MLGQFLAAIGLIRRTGSFVPGTNAPMHRAGARRVRRWMAVLLAGLASMSPILLAPAAQAADSTQLAPVMVVLDGSGSMLATDGTGTKIDAAKAAVHRMVEQVPDNAQLGLEVYGTKTGSSDAEKAAGCQDISLVHPVGPVDRAGIGDAVDAVNPRGYTPIGQSLRRAADALPKQGPRSIVLVSDGEDTCAPPDPCEVAKELKQRGVDLIVHTVGLGVDDSTRAQLTCIAAATGGNYTDTDAGSLVETLPLVAVSALRNYQVSGTPISGGTNSNSAPVVTAGPYHDTLGPRDKKYYAVDVPDGWSLYASSTIAYERSVKNSVQEDYGTALLRPDGTNCGIEDTGGTAHAQDGEALATGIAFHNDGSDSSCHAGGRYLVQVTRHGDQEYAHGAALPAELIVGLEPPVRGKQSAGTSLPYSDRGGADQPIAGSGSFSTATELPAAGHYVDSIQHGETLFFRVHLQWGQGLSYRLRYEPLSANGPGSAQVSTTLFNPARQTVDHDQGSYDDSPTTLPSGRSALSTPTIAYGNRDSGDDGISPATIPGWYYFSIKLGEAGSANTTGTPARLHVDLSVAGAVQPPPPYVGATPEQANGDGIFASAAHAGQPKQQPGQSQDPVRSTSSTGFSPWWLIGGAVVLLLVLVGVGVPLLVRAGRR